MNRVKRSLFIDPIDEAVSNNLSSSQLNSEHQGTLEDNDIAILESLIFPDTERSYKALDLKTSNKVHEALRESFKEEYSILSKIQCSHCNEIFTNDDFQIHLCQFDENHQRFQDVSEGQDETEFDEIPRSFHELLKKNQSLIASLISEKSKSNGVQCSKCCRKFVNEAGLMRHYEKHIGELLHESPPENVEALTAVVLCLVCGAVFGEESEAWNHLQSDHIEVRNSIDCLKVPASLLASDGSADKNNSQPSNKYFTRKENMIRSPSYPFVKSVFVSKVIQCEFCELTFINVKTALFHEASHDPSQGFSCNKCELPSLSFKDILLHRRDECIIFQDIRGRLRDFPRVWVCNTCEIEFRGLEQLNKHRYDEFHFFPRITARFNKLRFSCERCLEVFETATKAVEHFIEKYEKKDKHEAGAIASTSDRVEQSSTHMRKGGIHQTSTRPRQYLCHVCGKSYTQSSHLWQHLRFHEGVKPFGCEVEGCGRRFTIRPDLNDHVRKCHTGERPYLCTICDKRFLTGSVYYQHRLIHRGERRYGCDECGKRFYRADALKNHERIHTGEKPYTCHECGKKFRQRGDRDKHMKTRHPDADVIASPRKPRVKSFGRGRIKNNTSLYCSMPPTSPV